MKNKEQKKVFKDVFNTEDQFSRTAHLKSILIQGENRSLRPLITVAIPTYKRASTLKETLESVLGQECAEDLEIIVVDNNPERGDETERLMATYNNDSRICYYKNEVNLGAAGNWNRLYTLAKGEWVCMLHDDDCLLPGYIPNVKMLLERLGNQADALFFMSVKQMKTTSPEGSFRLRKLGLVTDLMAGSGIDIPGNLIRRDVVLRLGGFNGEYYPCFDYHLWLKLYFMGRSFVVKGCPLAYYRIAINDSRKTETIIQMVSVNTILQKAVMTEVAFWGRWCWNAYLPFLNAHRLSRLSCSLGNHTEEMSTLVKQAKESVTIPEKVFGFFMRHLLSLNRKRADFFATRVKVIG